MNFKFYKYILVILVILNFSSLSYSLESSARIPANTENKSLQEKLEEKKRIALRLMYTAIDNTLDKPDYDENSTDGHLVKSILSMKRILMTVNINIPNDGRNFAGCKENTLAFALDNSIYLCRLLLDDRFNYTEQVLIHEVAHLAEYPNECDATILEMYVMRMSANGYIFKNGYMTECMPNIK